MSSVSTAFKVHYNQKLGGPSGHLGDRTMASGPVGGGDRRPWLKVAAKSGETKCSRIVQLVTSLSTN